MYNVEIVPIYTKVIAENVAFKKQTFSYPKS